MSKTVRGGGAVAGSGASSRRAAVGPAESLAAGLVGVPLPMAFPQPRPPPALHTPHEEVFFQQLYMAFAMACCRRGAPVGSGMGQGLAKAGGCSGIAPQHPPTVASPWPGP